MLPIHQIKDQILQTVAKSNRLVLTAPTGCGKTTQVPQFLLRGGETGRDRQILVLQPRRLAARLVAARVAAELNTPLGQLVGYQTRHDSRISGQTIIRFLTEGLFLRLLQSNPKLDGAGFVLLDEFHERNLASDVALALVKLLQESSRPDLRLIVMSATLDTQLVSQYLACPVLEAQGRMFPVEITYLARRPTAAAKPSHLREARRAVPPWELAADALSEVLASTEDGDVLIFMPGGYEIRRTIEQGHRVAGGPNVSFHPLYSELPPDQQDAALAPAAGRKVIVSTNVAETSITIPGIRHVIDCGLARINRFDPVRGINVLMIEPISQASAEQRAGRAGRTAPGTCRRLWPRSEHRHRPAHTTPEIQRLDLAEVVLHLFSLGVRDVEHFPWLEPPDEPALDRAIETLIELGALTEGGRSLSPLGPSMARLPMHPRLSRMLVEAAQRGCLERAALWAAFISERDILVPGAAHHFADDLAQGFPRSDFLVLEAALSFARKVGFDPGRCADRGVNANACREVERTCRLYLDSARGLSLTGGEGRREGGLASMAQCLLVAFPDHLASRRSDRNPACDLTAGRRAQLDPDSVARRVGLILPLEITELEARAAKGQLSAGAAPSVRTVLSLATEIDLAWVHQLHADKIRRERATVYRPDSRSVETVDRQIFMGLALEESPLPQPDPSAAAEILAEQVARGVLKLEKWDDAVEQWIERTRCVAEWFPERRLITYSDDDLHVIIQEICGGASRYSQIKDRPCLPHVKDALCWEDQQFVEQMAPDRYELPRGWRMKIEYCSSPPVARGRAKIQDLYGLKVTPTVAGGRVPILLEILAPNMRPVQVTEDLANFWANLYPTLRKELSRRYPRHEWR